MAGRAPRQGGCPTGGGARLTRTQMLRQAKSAAVVHKEPHDRRPEPASAKAGPSRGACPGPRTGLAKLGPPPADPKKIDFARPGMTKAMALRQKLAAEKLGAAAEAQRRIDQTKRRPTRTPAPVSGDARLGRQRAAPSQTPGLRTVKEAVDRGHVTARRGRDPNVEAFDAALDDAVASGHIVTDRRGAIPKRPTGGPTTRRRGPAATATPIPEVAKELARSMNADVVQAVPMTDGPVDKIIIPPGTINDDRNTIVCIAQPAGADGTDVAGASGLANRSIQVISETLNEQDAVESAAVQGKLEELQHARREFVMAVANVGGNAVNIPEDGDVSVLDLEEMDDGLDYIPTPPRARRVVKMPDVSHEMFQVDYGTDHPDILAAREFGRRAQVNIDQRAAERRIEEDFARMAGEQPDDLRFDVPFAQDIMEGDISFEEDEEGNIMPCPSRIKASMPPIPKRVEGCPYRPISVDELERFFNVEQYPPTPEPPGPPPGRAGLHPDLWELDDPWYREATPPEVPDLMRFDDSC